MKGWNQWVLCKDRLPNQPQNLVVTVKYGENNYIVDLAWWDGDEFRDEDMLIIEDVVAWLEFPEPYKEEV